MIKYDSETYSPKDRLEITFTCIPDSLVVDWIPGGIIKHGDNRHVIEAKHLPSITKLIQSDDEKAAIKAKRLEVGRKTKMLLDAYKKKNNTESLSEEEETQAKNAIEANAENRCNVPSAYWDSFKSDPKPLTNFEILANLGPTPNELEAHIEANKLQSQNMAQVLALIAEHLTGKKIEPVTAIENQEGKLSALEKKREALKKGRDVLAAKKATSQNEEDETE